jgi:hypothetical protein
MTQAEFYAAERAAQKKYRELYRKIQKGLAELYKTAANQIAEKIRQLDINGRGTSLTRASYEKLESSLRKTGAYLAGEVENIIVDGITDLSSFTSKPHLSFISDAVKLSDTRKIDFSIIETMYSNLNTTLIDLTYTRLWNDGYTFVERIWKKIPANFQQAVKSIVSMGIAQGRDILQIAKDLTFYAAYGKEKLIKRYGEIVRGTYKFKKRIPKNIDYRAMAIARSELYISLQEAAKFQGSRNPAVYLYDWNLTGGTGIHVCICPDLAANSPYTENNIPNFPHTNCLCYITHRIRGRDEFVNDLIDWGKGLSIPYLDAWYMNVYLPAA